MLLININCKTLSIFKLYNLKVFENTFQNFILLLYDSKFHPIVFEISYETEIIKIQLKKKRNIKSIAIIKALRNPKVRCRNYLLLLAHTLKTELNSNTLTFVFSTKMVIVTTIHYKYGELYIKY